MTLTGLFGGSQGQGQYNNVVTVCHLKLSDPRNGDIKHGNCIVDLKTVTHWVNIYLHMYGQTDGQSDR